MRRLRAKRVNEQAKLFANGVNIVAAGNLAGVVIVPAVNAIPDQPVDIQ